MKKIVNWVSELRKIIEEGIIPLQDIDIKNSKINSLRRLFSWINFKHVNGSIKDWDISNIEDLSFCFESTINIPKEELKNWNTSNVIYMSWTFLNSEFDWNISNWDFKRVGYTDYMFENSFFNWDTSKWNFENIIENEDMFKNSKLDKDKIEKLNINRNYLTIEDLEWIF